MDCMSLDRICFNISDMDLQINKEMIQFLWENTGYKDKQDFHPLFKVCEMIHGRYDVEISAIISSNALDAQVYLEFDKTLETKKKIQISRSFTSIVQELLHGNMTMLQ